MPDLLNLQQAASDAGVPFWVVAGFQPTNAITAGKVLPTAFVAPCPMTFIPQPQPAPTLTSSTPPLSPTPALVAPQSWLGTVVQVADDPSGVPSEADETRNGTASWLDENAWRFGFVPGLPESTGGIALGHEPWTFRWVGKQMARLIQPLTHTDAYGQRAKAVLEQAEEELDGHAQ